MSDVCPICKRKLGTENIDEHHLIPKAFKGKEKFPLHKICHRKIHATFSERELKNYFYTWEAILETEEMRKFVKWVSKKEPGFYSGSKETSNRKSKRRR